jgi:hypothetical protein
MGLWGMTEEFFEAGLALDPSGCGAGWARIAIAECATDPVDALECARRAVAANPDAWGPWFASFIAQPAYQAKDGAAALLAAAYDMLSSARPGSTPRPAFAGAVPRAKYRDALVVTRARIADKTTARVQAAGPTAGDALQRAIVFVAVRLVGLALVFLGLAIFYAMTVPGGWWCEYTISGFVAVCATSCGLPLLVTGAVGTART